jgi:hypothetical protein
VFDSDDPRGSNRTSRRTIKLSTPTLFTRARRRLGVALRIISLFVLIASPTIADAQPVAAADTPTTISAPLGNQPLSLFGEKTAASEGITFHVTGYKGFGQVRLIFETTLPSGAKNVGVSDAINVGKDLWRTQYKDSAGRTSASDPCGIQCDFQNPGNQYPYLTMCGDGYCAGARAAAVAATAATCFFTFGFGCAAAGVAGAGVAALGCSGVFTCPECRLYGPELAPLTSNPFYDLEARIDVSCQNAEDAITVNVILYNVDIWDHPVQMGEGGTGCYGDPRYSATVSHCSSGSQFFDMPAGHCYAIGGSWTAKHTAYPTGLMEAYSGTTASNGDLDTREQCLDNTGAAPGQPANPKTPLGVI